MQGLTSYLVCVSAILFSFRYAIGCFETLSYLDLHVQVCWGFSVSSQVSMSRFLQSVIFPGLGLDQLVAYSALCDDLTSESWNSRIVMWVGLDVISWVYRQSPLLPLCLVVRVTGIPCLSILRHSCFGVYVMWASTSRSLTARTTWRPLRQGSFLVYYY